MAGPANGITVGATIDYLVATLTTGATITDGYGRVTVIPPISTVNQYVEVADNMPTTSDGAWVIVGRQSVEDGSVGAGELQYLELGGVHIEETYTVAVICKVVLDSGSQQDARNQVIALFNHLVRLLHADPGLGGIIRSGRVALASRYALGQTQDLADMGAGGTVTAEIHSNLEVTNSFIP